MGLSGSGKSTLVRCLISLIEATSGEIMVDGDNVTTFNDKQLREFRRSKMALVFQNFGLLPHKNVLDNTAYGLEIRGLGKAERSAIAMDMLGKVGLTGWENANQRELSGGMQQRVGLARALAMDPAILLMDEPFSGLDPLIRRQMRNELAELQKEIQKTIIFITHDLDEAITVGDRIAIMRDGEIIQLGTPKEIIIEPADDFVEEFTQGISRTRVINISSISRDPQAICFSSDSVENLLEKLNVVAGSYAICLAEDNKYIGVIDKKRISVLGPNNDLKIPELIEASIVPIPSHASLEDALPMLSNPNIPLPIVDDANTFLGVVTQQDLIDVLTRNSFNS
jgi:glycine betaine/proline transport system ATP-binding protein